MRKRKRPAITITKIAIALAVVTTVLAMAASGSIVLSGGRNFEESIHSIALGIMLMAYLFLICVLMMAKQKQMDSLRVVEQDGFLVVSPCAGRDCLILDQAGIDRIARGYLLNIAKHRRDSIRIVVARDVSIPESFLEMLVHFPNMGLLDVQNAKVAPEFWTNLEELPNLAHVLATNALPADLLRNIAISLPEVKFWLGHHRNLVVATKAAMNPYGTTE
jgi:hypothetical protein